MSTDLVRRKAAEAVRMPRGVTLAPGQEWWVASPHLLAARIRADRRVAEVARYELSPDLHGALVARVRPRPTWRSKLALWALLGLLGAAAVGLVAYVLVTLWPLILAALIATWVILRAVAGHTPTCAGLHCPGCRH